MCKGKPPESKEQWNFKEYSNFSNNENTRVFLYFDTDIESIY